jgi:hypothetical protein
MLYVRANRCKEVFMADTKQVAAEALGALSAPDDARRRTTYADEVVFEAPGDVRIEGVGATIGCESDFAQPRSLDGAAGRRRGIRR